MAERLFRKVAMERRASPEQLDQLMQVASPKDWVTLAALGALLLGAILWACFGYIPIKATGQGMLMRSGGIAEIASSGSGQLKGLYFEPGELVEKGRTVARIDQPELLGRLREAEAALGELRAAKGEGQARLALASRALEALRAEYDAASRVRSPFSGRVLELTARAGDFVAKGAPLMKIEAGGPESGGMQALLYFPAGSGDRIRRGMSVQVSPLFVERSEYGFLLGLVTRVAEFPSSRQGMMRMLQDEALVDSLSRGGAPMEVYADLVPDASAPSGYKWSSSRGPESRLQTGSICQASVTVSRQRPISLVIPRLARLAAGAR
jgi:biotin carboxyl carrier protein